MHSAAAARSRGGRSWGAIAAALLLIALAAGLCLMPIAPERIERDYATSVYPSWQRLITPLGNALPIALFDVLIVVVAIAVAWRVGTALFTTRRGDRGTRPYRGHAAYIRGDRPRTGRLRALGRAGLDVAGLAAVLVLWFVLSWGLNYRRQPLQHRLDFDAARATPAAALTMARTTVEELNRLHPIAHAAPWPSLDALAPTLAAAFGDTQAGLGQRMSAAPGRPKPTLLQPYFTWAAIDGMTDPFFLETLVSAELLPFERPFVVAHEWGHLAGYAHEAEANFFGWITCQRAGPQAQYSAWVALYFHLAAALAVEDRKAIDAALGAGPRRDLHAVVARYARSAPQVRVVAWRAYDSFLKVNRVAEGVASYDGVVRLLLGTSFDPGWRPRGSPAGAPAR